MLVQILAGNIDGAFADKKVLSFMEDKPYILKSVFTPKAPFAHKLGRQTLRSAIFVPVRRVIGGLRGHQTEYPKNPHKR